MPTFTFTSPDGKQISVTGPDGATPEQAFKVLQDQGHAAPQQAAPAGPVGDADKGGVLKAAAHGFAEPFVGAGQLLLHGADAVNQALPGGGSKAVSNFVADNDSGISERKAQYDADQKAAGAGIGTGAAELAGNLANPLNWLPVAKAAKLVTAGVPIAKSLLQGALVGGALSPATQSVDVNKLAPDQSFAGAKTRQAAEGAAVGAVAGPVLSAAGSAARATVDGLGRVAAKGIDSIASKVGDSVADKVAPLVTALRDQGATGAAADKIVKSVMELGDKLAPGRVAARDAAEVAATTVQPQHQAQFNDAMNGIRDALQAQGQSFANLGPRAEAQIKAETARALNEGRPINAHALLLQADARLLGATGEAGLTAGQMNRSGSPSDFASEINLSQQPGGEGLANRFANQREHVGGVLRDIAGPGAALDRNTAGNQLVSELQAINIPKQATAARFHKAASEAEGRSVPLDHEVFLGQVDSVLGDKNLIDKLDTDAPGIRKMLDRVRTESSTTPGGTKRPFDVDRAEQIDQLLSAEQRKANGGASPDPQLSAAIGHVRDALGLTPTATGATSEARELLAKGKPVYAAYKNSLTPAIEEALQAARNPHDFNADTFLEKHITGRNVSTADVQALAKFADGNPVVKETVRGAFGKKLLDAMQGKGDVLGDSKSKASAFNVALKDIGRDKLAAFFDPHEVEQLFAAGRLLQAQVTPPAGAIPNYSGTSGAVAGLLSKFLPGGLGGALKEASRTANIRNYTRNALADNSTARERAADAIRNRLAQGNQGTP